MFAVYAAEPNHEDPLASLRVGDRPDPEVPAGTVAVAVAAASLNMHDLWTLRGVGIKPEQFPMILGCDGAGALPDGSEVVIYPVVTSPGWFGDETLDPRRTLLTEKLPGTFADTVVVPARNVVPKPPSLTFPEAACMGTAWLTAYRMLFVKSGLRAGQTMLVQGASGGVSTALVQLGRAAGMRVWATGRTDDKRARRSRWARTRRSSSGARLPERVDAVFETVGKATWSHSAKSLKPGGIIVCCGATSGDADPPPNCTGCSSCSCEWSAPPWAPATNCATCCRFWTSPGSAHTSAPSCRWTKPEQGFQSMLDGDTAGKIVFTR